MDIKIYRRHRLPRACDTHLAEAKKENEEGSSKRGLLLGKVAGCRDCDQRGCVYKVEPLRKKGCECGIWFQYNEAGKQIRVSAKTSDWEVAKQRARKLEDGAKVGQPVGEKPATLAEAIAKFLEDKEKGDHSPLNGQVLPDTLDRHELTLKRLQSFCDSLGIVNVRDITAQQLDAWRNSGGWGATKPQARAMFQSRVKNFFKFCFKYSLTPTNLSDSLAPIKVKVNPDAIRPLSVAQYKKLLAAINETNLTDANKLRVRTMMKLQREAGLSLVDAALFSDEELQKNKAGYSVRTDRQKTGTGVLLPISNELAKELLNTKRNGHPPYVFWSGNTRPEDAGASFQPLYKKVFTKAGIEGSSHDLRHTFAVEFLNQGGTMRQLSRALGHSSIAVTEKFYGKWSVDERDTLQQELRAVLPDHHATV